MTLIDTISQQTRVIYSIMSRDVKMRTKTSPIGIVSLFIEPLAFICMMTLIFSYVRMRGMDLGEHLMIFFATGIIPLYCFKHLMNGSRSALTRNRQLMYFSLVRPFDILAATVIEYFLINTILFYIIVYAFVLLYDYRGGDQMILCMIPMFCNALIGLGFGVAIAIAAQFFKYIVVITSTLFGPINILSGVFFTAETISPWVRDILWWNPFFHSTELLRTFYYAEYTSPLFDPYYYFGWVVSCLVLGLGLERLLRHRLFAVAG